jgi:four helix bundle protein
MHNFRDMDIWKDSIAFVDSIYNFSEKFPSKEKFNLTSQIERAAVSISSNITEGASRSSNKDFARFIEISLGSSFEVESLLEIIEKRNYIESVEINMLVSQLNSIQKRMNAFRTYLLKNA